MTVARRLLHSLYRREEPLLQANDWVRLRVPLAALVGDLTEADRPGVPDAIAELRKHGKIMLLPDWTRWGQDEDEHDGTSVSSEEQWEPVGSFDQPPQWNRRPVFLPANLDHWFLRSRVAETIRLLGSNRERFGLEPSTAHVGYLRQERKRPARGVAVALAVQRLQRACDGGEFPGADRQTLRAAIAVAGDALLRADPPRPTIAAFQQRAWLTILHSLFGKIVRPDATMITAGVSSGKTYAFLLPALTLLVYRTLKGEGGAPRVLVVYPRVSLVEDQFRNLENLLGGANAALAAAHPGRSLTGHPALDAGSLLNSSLGATGALGDVIPLVRARRIEMILTTPESLKNRMLDPRAVGEFLRDVELVVLDEVHLMEGLAGCQQVYLLRRLRELLRELRGQPLFRPAWVGASATLARPVEHAARVFSVPADCDHVVHVRPDPAAEMEPFSLFHHAFIHTRVGKAAISAVTNGLSCLTHTRNNGTAHTHYDDPVQLVPRPASEMPKTIAFVDSLSTIGRLDFTTRDNERCRDADRLTPYPYYSWFYRPAARLRAANSEFNTQPKKAAQKAVREWCEKCYHGIPARVEAEALKRIPLPLRTHASMGETQERRATPPGLRELIEPLNGQVGNLDECPYHRSRVCWWFSGDRGDTRTVGGVQLYIDQNRTVAYTSRSEEATGRRLRDDVNEYFSRVGAGRGGLWSLTQANQALYQTLPDAPQRTCTMIASPKIEVGVDFDNVRDGLTHKAIRSAASFQQKVGRVGREGGTDCLIVTFLAHRSTDAHFAHHPERLIDSRYLDPVPLAGDNPDARATHLFTAILEHIGSRPPGRIPNAGERLNVIGTGSTREPGSWEAKVRAAREYLNANRAAVRRYILRAVATDPTAAPTPDDVRAGDEAIDQFRAVLGLFLVDLTPVFVEGRTAAHWFQLNRRPSQVATLEGALRQRTTVLDALRGEEAQGGLPALVAAAVTQLREATEANNAGRVAVAAAALGTASIAAIVVPGADAARLGAVIGFGPQAQAAATGLPPLPAGQLRSLLLARDMVTTFFGGTLNPQMELYYLHDVLTRLAPFREFYPHGLLRTHFQPIQARSVSVRLPQGGEGQYREAEESLDAVLYELLPGTWNYRWVRGYKSPCERVEQAASGEWCVVLDRIADRATFQDTGTRLTATELPPDMPLVPGRVVPMIRPVQLTLEITANQPLVRPQDGLIGDRDEADPVGAADDDDLPRCPTLPRAYPATWYRIAPPVSPLQPVIGEAAPGTAAPVPHTFPAFGRVWLDRVEFDERMTVDQYVHALDRTTGTWVESPRLHYRRGADPLPVVIGDTLHRTDGLRFKLNEGALNAVLDEAVAVAGPVRGEVTLRALRRFIARVIGCDPFRAALLRKVIATAFLDGGGRLDGFDAAAVRAALAATDETSYAAIAARLVNGSFVGSDPTETTVGAQHQAEWYARAEADFVRLRAAAAQFTDAVVRNTGRDLLIHTLAVTGLDAAAQLVGAGDNDLGYFHDPACDAFYLFDRVEGGNGYAETVRDYLHIPPLRRIVTAREDGGDLPTSDWFGLFEQTASACPAQLSTRIVFAACRCGVTDRDAIHLPHGVPVRDLDARLRHEFEGVTGSVGVIRSALAAFPNVFSDWPDLLWLQVVPEYFAPQVSGGGQPARSFTDLVTRTRVCVTGCLECVDNAEGSVFGALASAEHVSRPLLDVAVRLVRRQEPAAAHVIPAGADLGHALQARAGRPVLRPDGTPATAAVLDGGANRDVMITQVLSVVAIAPDAAPGPLLEPDGSAWAVRLPFVASYRDERGAQ